MNKKLLVFGILGLFAIALVSATIVYYSYAQVTININQPISVSGSLTQTVDCDAGEVCIGSAIRIDNSDDEDRTISLREQGSGSDIEVNYVGKLNLENKYSSNWTVIDDDRKA